MIMLTITSVINAFIAGKTVSDDQVESMLESDDPRIFTQDVSCLIHGSTKLHCNNIASAFLYMLRFHLLFLCSPG